MIRAWHTWKTCRRLAVLTIMLLVLTVGGRMVQQVAAQTPAASGMGSTLIGKLEGPEVITDPAQFPKQFSEAPQLTELVKAGKLPPVAERIGQEPLVIKPVHEIGQYGGTWRRGFTGPADFWNGLHSVSGPDHILFWDYTGYKVGPNIAKGWKLSDDGRTTTIFLRQGMKWIDGHLFTADDFIFWYEDVYKNKELVPTPTLFLTINGKPGELEKVDPYTILKLPVFLENEQRGKYKVSLHPGDYGGDLIIKFNMTYDKDPEIARWFHNRDFRRALAITINRDQINEIFWLGTSAPRSVVPVDSNPYFPGPEYSTMWATYDPKQANAMLDAIGLDKKDAEGYRLRTDGKGRLRLAMTVAGAAHAPFEQFVEPVKQHWKEVGIDLHLEVVERSLAITRGAANETQLSAWNNDGSEHPWTFPFHLVWLSISTLAPAGPEYAKWFHSGGKEGKEPTGRIREMMDLWVKGMGVSEEERIALGKQIWKIAAEDVYIIGIVGPGAASGVRVAKVNMGNLPARMYISPDGKAESISRPVTYFYKN